MFWILMILVLAAIAIVVFSYAPAQPTQIEEEETPQRTGSFLSTYHHLDDDHILTDVLVAGVIASALQSDPQPDPTPTEVPIPDISPEPDTYSTPEPVAESPVAEVTQDSDFSSMATDDSSDSSSYDSSSSGGDY